MWMTSCTGSVRGGFWGQSVELRRRLTFGARRSQASGLAAGDARDVGQMEKSGESLSLCRKTFKLKGNKKFRAWTKKS